MEKETKDPENPTHPEQPEETQKKEEALLKMQEETDLQEASEQPHEIDTHKKEDEPSTFLPFGGE